MVYLCKPKLLYKAILKALNNTELLLLYNEVNTKINCFKNDIKNSVKINKTICNIVNE